MYRLGVVLKAGQPNLARYCEGTLGLDTSGEMGSATITPLIMLVAQSQIEMRHSPRGCIIGSCR